MFWRWIAPGLGVLLLAGCATSHTTLQNASPRTPKPAIYQTLDRQIQNAADAGDGDPRIPVLRRRLAADPKDTEARIMLAEIYKAGGQLELALDHYRLARHDQPASEAFVLEEAALLEKLDSAATAIACLTDYIQVQPGASPSVLTRLAILHDSLAEYEKAEGFHRRSLALAPQNGPLRNNLGYNLLLQKRYADAAAEFRQALAMEPGSEVARNNLGLALASDPALAAADKALAEWKTASSAAAAHNNLAAVFIEQKRYKEARLELQAALQLDRHFLPALRNLDLVSRLDGAPATLPVTTAPSSRWQKMVGAVRKALRSSPSGPIDPARASESFLVPPSTPASPVNLDPNTTREE